jgi:nitrite reductase (NO-forming)
MKTVVIVVVAVFSLGLLFLFFAVAGIPPFKPSERDAEAPVTMIDVSGTPQNNETAPVTPVESQPEAPVANETQFTLQTITGNGKLLFVGVGGDIDGIINPDLIVQPGTVVRILLTNGDGMPHDLYLPDWEIKTEYVSKIGDETEIFFEVGDMQPGTYVYYCTVPGHRQAGQEGKLIVTQP